MKSDVTEFSRGWRYILGAFVGIGGSFASLYFYTAGLFLKPLAEQFEWTRAEASMGALSFMIGNMIALPFAGRLVDRFGEVRVAFTSGMGLAISFALMGLAINGLTSFLLLVLLLTLVSAGCNSVSYNRVIVRHFKAHRGLALGLALTGTTLGATLVTPFLAPFIETHGWRPAYYVLAVAAAVLTFIAAILLREPDAHHDRKAQPKPLSWRVICSYKCFYTISAMIFLSATAVLGTTLHIVPMLTDGGMSVAMAGAIASALGVSVLIGRIVAGHILDRWDAGWVSFILLALAGTGALLLSTSIPALILPGALLIGFGVGTEGDLLAYLLGRRFPVHSFSSVYGTIFAVHAFGSGVGGMLAGVMFDMTGNYRSWLLLASVMLVAGGLIALMTERNVKPLNED